MEPIDISRWVDIFNERHLSHDEIVQKYQEEIKKSTQYVVSLALQHGRHRLAVVLFENVLVNKNYNSAKNEIENLIQSFPPTQLKQLSDICEKYKYTLTNATRFHIAVLSRDEESLNKMINDESYFTFMEYKFIMFNGTMEQIIKYYEQKIKSSLYLKLKLIDYLGANFLSKVQLAERPKMFDYFCAQGVISKRITIGPFYDRLRSYIVKWKLIVTDEIFTKTDEIFAFIHGLESNVNNPVVKELPPNTKDVISLEMMKPGELYLTCGTHYSSLDSIKTSIFDFDGDPRYCPRCHSRVPYKVYRNIRAVHEVTSEAGEGAEQDKA